MLAEVLAMEPSLGAPERAAARAEAACNSIPEQTAAVLDALASKLAADRRLPEARAAARRARDLAVEAGRDDEAAHYATRLREIGGSDRPEGSAGRP
jgi:hypothetical protein